MPDSSNLTPSVEPTPQRVAWIAPTERGRAQQLLDTHPHLEQAAKELDWLPNKQLLQHATDHVAATTTKAGLAAARPAQTADLDALAKTLSQPLTELRGLLKKKFKAAYQAYYPQFGLVRVGKNWQLPRDRDDLEIALRDYLLPALNQYDLAADPDAGTAVWQPLLTRLTAGLAAARDIDSARSVAVGEASPLDALTEKALRCLFHLAIAHNPDTWESVLRGWGWRKTSF